MQLTEQQFWDDYWANIKLPNRVDYQFSFERCLAHALKNHMPTVQGDVFEIGCAPGKWLAFMAEEFSLVPHGIDYSQAGMQATLNNFKMLNINPGHIMAGDFFQVEPEKKYDVVMSFGFIEHFTDVDTVVARHLAWLKPGGILVLGVPNFCGIYHTIQKQLRQDILEKHNLKIMNRQFFTGLSSLFHLTPLWIGYIGSFEPSLPIAYPGFGNPKQILIKSFLKCMRVVRNYPIFDNINHSFFSAYLLGIYQKN